jgi:hypothetical protein
MTQPIAIPSVSVTYAQAGTSTKPNELGMRPMQERAYQKRGEQYLLIKSPDPPIRLEAPVIHAGEEKRTRGFSRLHSHG